MPSIKNIFQNKTTTISFELFPPKTPEGHEKLLQTIHSLVGLKPDFFSCTYGAGGSSRGKTLDIVSHIQDTYKIPAMAHLTCVMHTQEDIRRILDEMQQRKISNVLALRGDPPKDNPNYQLEKENFAHSCDLIKFVRAHLGSGATIGAAGFPEGHVLAPSKDFDAKVLQEKITSGADFIITQLFFNNQDYFDYVNRLKNLGVTARIIPGILPITDYNALVRFCALCGATIPEKVHRIFKPLADNPQATAQAGIDFAIAQCKDLLNNGSPGLHFYTLNKISPTDKILQKL